MVKSENTTISDMLSSISKEDMNKIEFFLKWFYHKNKPETRVLKQLYQKSKIIEEIGELGQAIATGNKKPSRYKSYEDVRGTIESELADVCIAVLGYLSITKKQLMVFETTIPCVDDGETLIFKLLQYASEEYFCKLFNIICSFSIENDIDIIYNIKERIKFNNSWAIRYRDGLKNNG